MKEYQFAFPMEVRPDLAPVLRQEPILLDGLRVLFDEKVGLYPVTLEEKNAPTDHAASGRNGRK